MPNEGSQAPETQQTPSVKQPEPVGSITQVAGKLSKGDIRDETGIISERVQFPKPRG